MILYLSKQKYLPAELTGSSLSRTTDGISVAMKYLEFCKILQRKKSFIIENTVLFAKYREGCPTTRTLEGK